MSGDHNKYQKGGVVIDKSAAVRIATSIGWKSPSELNEAYCKGRDDGFEAGRLAQRTWVGLTNDEVNNLAAGCHLGNSVQGAIYKAEAKLKEKNT